MEDEHATQNCLAMENQEAILGLKGRSEVSAETFRKANSYPYNDPLAAMEFQRLQQAYHIPSDKQAQKAYDERPGLEHYLALPLMELATKLLDGAPFQPGATITRAKFEKKDVLHSPCFTKHVQSFSPHTAPTCYTCPVCSVPVNSKSFLKDESAVEEFHMRFDTPFEDTNSEQPEEPDNAQDQEQVVWPPTAVKDYNCANASLGRGILAMDESNTTYGKRLRFENTPGLEQEGHMSWCSTQREKDVDAVDIADLPTSEDETCRFPTEESEWDNGEEEEKACSDRGLNATNRRHRFSRVYAINFFNGKANVPKKYKPVHGSPSACIKKNPYLFSEPIQTTRRIRVTFEDRTNKSQKMMYGSAFSLSPKVGCSARHCFAKDGMKVLAIDIREGSHVSPCQFDLESCGGQLLEVSTKQWSKTKDKDGLCSDGADIGMFQSKRKFKSFLLPCSVSFLSASQCQNVGIPSYPGVDNMLHKAKQELSKSSTSNTWKAYKPAMAKDIADEFQKFSASRHMKRKSKRQIMRAVLKNIKQVLYADLNETFSGHSSGDMLCAVGSIIAWNNVSIGSTCSTLRGSSGAPLCAFGLPGYFFGIHSGGVYGFDMNGATSTDNQEFVRMYMVHVLPTLPNVNSRYWNDIDMRGFIHWLKLHIDEIPNNSPWLAEAKKSDSASSAKHRY